MEKTKMMKRYEQETGISAIDPDELECYGREFVKVHTPEYVAWLEAELQTETIRADALKNAFDRLSEKVGVWANAMNARFFNPMDFVFCSQQVAEEMKEYADGKD